MLDTTITILYNGDTAFITWHQRRILAEVQLENIVNCPNGILTCDTLRPFGDGMFGKLAREDQSNTCLNFSRRDGRFFRVRSQFYMSRSWSR
jgi:hypothetical protein